MAPKNQIQPYENDAEYLDSEVNWLRLRLNRIEIEKRLGHAEREATESAETPRGRRPGVPELRGTLHELAHREQQARDEIDARLKAHRADSANPKLGLDTVCEHGLNDIERTALLAITVPSISKELASDTLHAQGGYCGHLSLGELVTILDPKGVGDWIQARRYFRPSAPLVKHGLVVVEPYGFPTAETLMNSNVELSLKAFAIIISDPEVLVEVPADDKQDQK